MPSLAEIWRALHGAWRLLLLDTHGLAEFDGSRSGGLRSLWAIALVLPLNIAVIAITELGEVVGGEAGAGDGREGVEGAARLVAGQPDGVEAGDEELAAL